MKAYSSFRVPLIGQKYPSTLRVPVGWVVDEEELWEVLIEELLEGEEVIVELEIELEETLETAEVELLLARLVDEVEMLDLTLDKPYAAPTTIITTRIMMTAKACILAMPMPPFSRDI